MRDPNDNEKRIYAAGGKVLTLQHKHYVSPQLRDPGRSLTVVSASPFKVTAF